MTQRAIHPIPAVEWQGRGGCCSMWILHQQVTPLLGASPVGAVYDPSSLNQPFGFLEIKCPYKHKNVTPQDACRDPTFCCTLSDITHQIVLKKLTHTMHKCRARWQLGTDHGVTSCSTQQRVDIQRVQFDEGYWTATLLPKLTTFYNNCSAPEIVSPVHVLGMPIRNLLNM